MADNTFLQGFQSGASIQSLAWAHQEQQIRLRAQQALQAMQERQMAAHVNDLVQHTEMIKQKMAQAEEEKRNNQALLLGAQQMHAQEVDKLQAQGLLKPEAEKLADQTVARTITQVNPKLGQVVAQAMEHVNKIGQRLDPSAVEKNTALAGLAKARTKAVQGQANMLANREVRLNQHLQMQIDREKRLANRYSLPEADKLQLQSLYGELRGVNTALEKLPVTPGEDPDASGRTQLVGRKAKLQKQLKDKHHNLRHLLHKMVRHRELQPIQRPLQKHLD